MSNSVSMAELNKRANAIINEVVESGESVTVYKHGTAVAEIVSIEENKVREDAIEYFLNNPPLKVDTPIDEMIAEGRNRGL
jgi:prevent-host-death family protein